MRDGKPLPFGVEGQPGHCAGWSAVSPTILPVRSSSRTCRPAAAARSPPDGQTATTSACRPGNSANTDTSLRTSVRATRPSSPPVPTPAASMSTAIARTAAPSRCGWMVHGDAASPGAISRSEPSPSPVASIPSRNASAVAAASNENSCNCGTWICRLSHACIMRRGKRRSWRAIRPRRDCGR